MSILNEELFEQNTATWRDVRQFFAGKWKIIVLVFVATVLGTYVGLQLMTDRYEGKATLLVKLGRENAEVPTTVQNSGFVSTGMRKEGVNSEVQILTSPSLIAETVDKFGPEAFAFRPAPPKTIVQAVRYYIKSAVRWVKDRGDDSLIALNLKKKLSSRDAAIQMLEDEIQVEPEKDSDVITVSLKFPDPQMCEQIIDNLLQLYLDRHMKAWRSPAAKEFFGEQLAQYKERLDEIQGARDQVKSKWNLSAINEQRSLLLKEVNELSAQIESNNAEMAGFDTQKSMMAARMGALPEQVNALQVQIQNPSIQSINERIIALQLERAKLNSRYLPDAEPVKKVDDEIRDLQAVLKIEQPTLVGSTSTEINPVRQNFTESIEQNRVKIAGLEAKNLKLRADVERLNGHLLALNSGEDEMESVDRDYKIAQESYDDYAKRVEEGRISDELDLARVSNISVLSPASASLEPVYPRKLLLLGVAAGLGLVLGIALALLLEYMDDRIRKPQDIAAIGNLRVLGTVRSQRAG
jgi:uncharacterized protein involved in exopolysaccharide biosynthesis